MKATLSLVLGLLVAGASTGCYCCKQQYDPCNGLSYQYKQFGVSLDKEGCVTCKNGCDQGCVTGACSHGSGGGPGCCDAGPGYSGPPAYGSGPSPEWQPTPAPAAAIEQTGGFRPTQYRAY